MTVDFGSTGGDGDNPEGVLTDADLDRIAAVMAESVDETPTTEHVRLAKMIAVAINEVYALLGERLTTKSTS